MPDLSLFLRVSSPLPLKAALLSLFSSAHPLSLLGSVVTVDWSAGEPWRSRGANSL